MKNKDKYKTPQGTIALMVIFILLIIIMWGSAYLNAACQGGNWVMHVDRTEKIFIIASIILVVVFALAIAVSSMAYNIQVPAPYEQVDPKTVATPPSPWGAPVEERVRELAPGKYEAYILAQTWVFQPNEIRIPAGSKSLFILPARMCSTAFIWTARISI